MSLTYDAVEDLKVLLKDNWTFAQPPVVEVVWKVKSVGFVDDRRDKIVIIPKNESIEYFSLYGTDFLHTLPISIEVRSYGEQDRTSEVVNEVLRILKANLRRTGFVDLQVIRSVSANDEYRNMFRHVVVCQYRQHYNLA